MSDVEVSGTAGRSLRVSHLITLIDVCGSLATLLTVHTAMIITAASSYPVTAWLEHLAAAGFMQLTQTCSGYPVTAWLEHLAAAGFMQLTQTCSGYPVTAWLEHLAAAGFMQLTQTCSGFMQLTQTCSGYPVTAWLVLQFYNDGMVFADEIGECYGEIEYRVVKFYNDGVVQAITFTYCIY